MVLRPIRWRWSSGTRPTCTRSTRMAWRPPPANASQTPPRGAGEGNVQRPCLRGSCSGAPARWASIPIGDEVVLRGDHNYCEASSSIVNPLSMEHGAIKVPSTFVVAVHWRGKQPVKPALVCRRWRRQPECKQASCVEELCSAVVRVSLQPSED